MQHAKCKSQKLLEGISVYSNNCNIVAHSLYSKGVGSYQCPEEKVFKSACKLSRDGEGGSCGQISKSKKWSRIQ